jgi:hypothetical protein
VFVVVGPFDSMATVMWRAEDKCGVRFDSMVADDMLERMKRDAQWESVSGWYR